MNVSMPQSARRINHPPPAKPPPHACSGMMTQEIVWMRAVPTRDNSVRIR